jgi:AcrR family transcriptional regulator
MSTHSDNTRQAIIKSAIETFSRKGYAGTSVQDILKTAKLSKPTLYYYFENKAGLFRAILDFAYDESFRLMREAVAGQTHCEDKLVAVATAMFGFAGKNKDLMRLVFSTVFSTPDEIPSCCANPTRRRCHLEFLRELVKEGRQNGELDTASDTADLTHAIFGAISHHIRFHLLMPEGKLDRKLAERVVKIYLNGAKKRK